MKLFLSNIWEREVNMIENEYELSNGRKIYVFREVYDYAHQLSLLKWSMTRPFNFSPSNEGMLVGQKTDTILSCKTGLSENQFKEMMRIDQLDPVKKLLSNK